MNEDNEDEEMETKWPPEGLVMDQNLECRQCCEISNHAFVLPARRFGNCMPCPTCGSQNWRTTNEPMENEA